MLFQQYFIEESNIAMLFKAIMHNRKEKSQYIPRSASISNLLRLRLLRDLEDSFRG